MKAIDFGNSRETKAGFDFYSKSTANSAECDVATVQDPHLQLGRLYDHRPGAK